MSEIVEETNILDRIIIGRVTPFIYAFKTNTVPNHLKVGDTYRPVSTRMREWKSYFPDLEKVYEEKATINKDIYFRDFSVHKFLEQDLQKSRLRPEEVSTQDYYSREFFKEGRPDDVEGAINDIKNHFEENTGKYIYYDAEKKLPENHHYERGVNWELRPNQQQVVDNFLEAINKGRTNLLMYAVMRFGKSFTSLCCAKAMNAEIVLIVSGKADVKEEWKKTVESAGNFNNYTFLSADDLSRNDKAIHEITNNSGTAVLFLTLQDLQGEHIKEKHKEIFNKKIDLLIIDETHFGARAKKYGEVLKNAGQKVDDNKTLLRGEDDQIEVAEAEEYIKYLDARVQLHLSGTPYRILMGSEFEKEDIISFVQFADIVNEKEKWDKEHLIEDNINEWDNPYYGFPQMVRFAFNPNKRSLDKMKALRKRGVTFTLSALFEPRSIKFDRKNKQHLRFQHEDEIFDLLKVIDGTKTDENLFGFLDYDKLKEGEMCRHMVMVLPYCASCDAMEYLINKHKSEFKNLSEYQIINISGVEGSKLYKNINGIKTKINQFESENQKTLTLTVNRMLTGSTVEQWDTMLYFKDTSSPQEYDQAIFRLQNQYTRELVSDIGVIRENLKPQTLLVDFDPARMFHMQEQKTLIYNVNTEENGNRKLRERLEEELRISPIIMMNHKKLREVDTSNILEFVSEYNNSKSIFDEIKDVPIDLNILSDIEIRNIINAQSEFGAKGGLSFKPDADGGEDLDLPFPDDEGGEDRGKSEEQTDLNKKDNVEDSDEKKLERKIQTFYQRILFFAFLSNDNLASINDIVEVIENDNNIRLASNLGLNKSILFKISQLINPFKLSRLDYKVQNISMLSNDDTIEPLDRALTSLDKFNRMSESEIITPGSLSDDMVNLFPIEKMKEMVDSGEKLLDIASKSGEYTVALYKRLKLECDFSEDNLRNVFYSIPTSKVAYEFTRRFYEILGLNVENIAANFTSYDLLEVKDSEGNTDYSKVTKLLRQKKLFCEIDLNEEVEEGEETVKFGAIVGNPPYHESDNDGGKGSAKPIYHLFVNQAKSLSSQYVSMITPSVWFVGGKGLNDFRNEMVNDCNLEKLVHFETSQDVFPTPINLRGGVNYFLWNSNYNNRENEIHVTTISNGEVLNEGFRKITVDNLEYFMPDNIAINMIDRLLSSGLIDSNTESPDLLMNYVSSRNPYNFTTTFVNDSKFKKDDSQLKNPIKMYASRGKIGYIERDLIEKNSQWIDGWKVLTPFANNIGTNLRDDNLNTIIGEPQSISTETYLVIGGDLGLDIHECNNLSKYLQSKFVRFLISLAKANQNGTRKTYRFVPLQNFTSSSDINWTNSLNEIDEQLFDKYSLSDIEKTHIRNSIEDI